MGYHLYIAGADRWRDIERDSLEIEQVLTSQIDSCRFLIRGERPIEGEEVIIEDDVLGRLFAGVVVKPELYKVQPDKSNKLWQVDCDDYTVLLDRKLVVEVYENMSASDIFLDIVAKYCPDFTTQGVQLGAPVVESTGVEFDYKRPSECFRWLGDYCGWNWQPDYYKDLKFFNLEDSVVPAPMPLTPGGKFRFGKHSVDIQGLRNRVFVKGGKMLSDPQILQWKADGVARQWVLPWGPHEVSLAVGEDPKTIGVENLHDEAEYAYMMNFNEKYIRCSAHTTTPVEGVTIALTAKQDLPVITVVEDYLSQQAVKAVQGGDGIYEHVISDDSLSTIQAAEAAGLADLREHANPRIKGNFETEYVRIVFPEEAPEEDLVEIQVTAADWAAAFFQSSEVEESGVYIWSPGQIVSVQLPDRGVVGEYLIQRVNIRRISSGIWTFKIDYGGKLLGIADFLKALVSAQQKKKNLEPAQSVQKFVYGEDTLGFSDELITATRELPFICGDEDAICGMVVVA